jgi:hypothetical protein
MFEKQYSFLSVGAALSHSRYVQRTKDEIRRLYRDPMSLGLTGEAEAYAVIRTIRHLEQELIHMRLIQPGCYL